MKRAIIFSFLLLTIAARAQTLSSSLVSSGGGPLGSADVSMVISIGQPVVGNLSAANVSLSQGFLMSPGEVITAVINKDITLNVFPNPVGERLFIQSEQDLRQMQVVLIDMNGRKIPVTQTNTGHRIELELYGIAPALYVLKLQQPTGIAKTISIIKLNQ